MDQHCPRAEFHQCILRENSSDGQWWRSRHQQVSPSEGHGNNMIQDGPSSEPVCISDERVRDAAIPLFISLLIFAVALISIFRFGVATPLTSLQALALIPLGWYFSGFFGLRLSEVSQSGVLRSIRQDRPQKRWGWTAVADGLRHQDRTVDHDPVPVATDQNWSTTRGRRVARAPSRSRGLALMPDSILDGSSTVPR
jgi:hypothetical protein